MKERSHGMADVFQLGPFFIKSSWIVIVVSAVVGYLVMKLRIKQANLGASELMDNTIGSLILLGIVIWKGSYLFLHPQKVIDNPMTLLYYSGGVTGIWIAVASCMALLYIWSKRQKISMWEYVDSIAVGFVLFWVFYLSLSLLWDKQDWKADLLMIGTGCLFLILVKKRRVTPQVLSVALLVSLICKTIIDTFYGTSEFIANKDVPSYLQGSLSKEQEAPIGIKKGEQAPDFELNTLEGQKVKLSTYRGQKVILNFWATWCPPCQIEMPDLQEFHQDYRQKGVVILGVNLTATEKNMESVAGFVQQEGVTFPILLDVTREVAKRYQAISIPTSYFIDEQGIIRQKVIGPVNYEQIQGIVGGNKKREIAGTRMR
ncbi:hypothetical protein C4A76_10980 [Brevibacillus laterosporus]|nr:hypothetical protein C4A76_10980 [Brevibacillus laterosporus]